MSQKQAISQTPIDLKPEDEARAKAKSGAASPEATPTPPSGEVQAVPNRDQHSSQSQAVRKLLAAFRNRATIPFRYPPLPSLNGPPRKSVLRRQRAPMSRPTTTCPRLAA